jgi:hypothetical protein
VGQTTGEGTWTLLAGFWHAVEEELLAGAGPAGLGGKDGAGAGVANVVDVQSVRRLRFGLEAGNRLAVPSIDEGAETVSAAGTRPAQEPRLMALGRLKDGWLRFEAQGEAGGRWLVQACTDLRAGQWRTVSWVDLDGAGLGWIEVEPVAMDATVLLRLVWKGP